MKPEKSVKQAEEQKQQFKAKKRPLTKELEVLSEEEGTPLPSEDHKLLFGSKVKPVRQSDKIEDKRQKPI